jgi:predicted transcriptional regulator
MAIRPKYVRAILAGRKTVELRRRAFGRDVSHVVIYATHPIQRIVASFDVQYVDQLPRGGAWRSLASAGAITRAEFASYFDGAESVVAIGITNVTRVEPTCLDRVGRRLRPPQSYVYLTGRQIGRLRALGLMA